MKQLFLKWFCAITDFFGIFVMVSWVFYEPQSDHLHDAFTFIQTVWFYKLFCIYPMIIVISIGMLVGYNYESWSSIKYKVDGSCPRLCTFSCSFLAIAFLWICGIVASSLVLEIGAWTFCPIVFYLLGTDRFSQNKSSLEFWFGLIGWVRSAQKHRVGSLYKGYTSFTKKQDKIMRLCCINHMILKSGLLSSDHVLSSYLDENLRDNQYMEVTMGGLRVHSKEQDKSMFTKKIWRLYGSAFSHFKYELTHSANRGEKVAAGFFLCGTGLVTFLLGPIYFVTRFATICFPGFIIVYLYVWHDVNIWYTEHVDIFQVVMISIYLGLCCIIFILLWLNCKEQYLMAHVLPSSTWMSVHKSVSKDALIKKITNHYYGIIVIPIRRAIVIDAMGPDLGPIVLSYLPTDEQYEHAYDNVTLATGVV